MMRHWLVFAAAVTAATPALAQDGPPGAGAPFLPPPPPVGYPGAGPMAAGPMPYPPGQMLPPPGVPPYAYDQGGPAGPCGCAGAAYSYTWVPVHVRTHYVYSAPIEHVREVPVERVVYREAVETRTVPVRGPSKYVKSVRRAKLTKGKTVRTAK